MNLKRKKTNKKDVNVFVVKIPLLRRVNILKTNEKVRCHFLKTNNWSHYHTKCFRVLLIQMNNLLQVILHMRLPKCSLGNFSLKIFIRKKKEIRQSLYICIFKGWLPVTSSGSVMGLNSQSFLICIIYNVISQYFYL